MRQPTLTDYSLLVFLGVVWASAFFNIKLATDSFGPITINNGITVTVPSTSNWTIV